MIDQNTKKTCRNPDCEYVERCRFASNQNKFDQTEIDDTSVPLMKISPNGIARLMVVNVDQELEGEAQRLLGRLGEYRGLFVYVCSPGGYHSPAESIINIIKEIGRTVPVIAYIDHASSAGLEVALACQEVYIASNGSAGGLGTHYFVCFEGKTPCSIASAISTQKKLDIESGPNAYEPRPYTEKIRHEIQEMCDKILGKIFLSILDSRETSLKMLVPLSDGSQLKAADLVTAGLADGVMEPEEALNVLKTLIILKELGKI